MLFPSYWGCPLAEETTTLSQFRSSVEGLSAILFLSSGFLSLSRSLFAPPSRAQSGSSAVRPVLEAM